MNIGTELIMPFHHDSRKLFFQDSDQIEQGRTLERGAGIRRHTFGRKTAFITNADGMKVESGSMRTDLAKGAGVIYLPVARDVKMIPCPAKSAGTVSCLQLGRGERDIATGGTAMDHDQFDFPFGIFGRDEFFHFFHNGYMHEVIPMVLAMVVAIAMMILRMVPQVELVVLLMVCYFFRVTL